MTEAVGRPAKDSFVNGGCYYEFNFPSANIAKFWSFQFVPSSQRRSGVALLLQWGRIGTDGQSKLIEFDSDEFAILRANERANAKVEKGYVLVGPKALLERTNPERWTPRAAVPSESYGFYKSARRERLSVEAKRAEPPPPQPVKIDLLVLTTRRTIDFEE